MIRWFFILWLGCSCANSIAQDSKSSILLDTLFSLAVNTDITNQEVISRLEEITKVGNAESDKKTTALGYMYLSSYQYMEEDYVGFNKSIDEINLLTQDSTLLSMNDLASVTNNRGMYERLKGNYKAAIERFLEALSLQRRIKPDPIELGIIYSNISNCYTFLGDHVNALEMAKKRLALLDDPTVESIKKSARILNFAESYYRIGNVYEDSKDKISTVENLNKSMDYFAQYFRLTNEITDETHIFCIQKLARHYIESKALDKAEIYIKMLDKFQKILPIRIYETLEIKGRLAREKLLYSEAVQFYKQALADAKIHTIINSELPVKARISMKIGDALALQDSLTIALFYYQSALQELDSELGSDPSAIINTSNINATSLCFEILEKKSEVALRLLEQRKISKEVVANNFKSHLDLIDHMRLSFLRDGSKFEVSERAFNIYNSYLNFLYEQYTKKDDIAIIEDIINTIERNKAINLQESLEKKVDLINSKIPITLLDKERNLRSDISFFTKLLKREKIKGDLANKEILLGLEDKLQTLHENHLILDNNLKAKYSEYQNIVENKLISSVKLDSLQMFLKKDEMVIEFYENAEYVYILGITKKTCDIHRHLRTTDLSQSIANCISYVSAKPKSNNIDFDKESMNLYNSILSPLLKKKSKIKRLIIVPDGQFNQLPLECLLIPTSDGSDTEFAIRRFEISYFIALTQLLKSDNKVGGDKKHVLCYAPKFNTDSNDDNDRSNLKELKYAQEEIEYLSNTFEGEFRQGNDASTNSFLSQLGNYEIVHLATHASLNESDPMLSEIYFSDGSITSYDVQNLNVSPDLVVLSACNTAKGDIQIGEGVMSLSRGFFHAGVRSMQSTLWSIDDKSSFDIIRSMYSRLRNGETKSAALHNAKIDFLKSADKLRSHPYYWAGIIQIGDREPLFKTNLSSYYLIGGIFILFISFWIITRVLRKKRSGLKTKAK